MDDDKFTRQIAASVRATRWQSGRPQSCPSMPGRIVEGPYQIYQAGGRNSLGMLEKNTSMGKPIFLQDERAPGAILRPRLLHPDTLKEIRPRRAGPPGLIRAPFASDDDGADVKDLGVFRGQTKVSSAEEKRDDSRSLPTQTSDLTLASTIPQEEEISESSLLLSLMPGEDTLMPEELQAARLAIQAHRAAKAKEALLAKEAENAAKEAAKSRVKFKTMIDKMFGRIDTDGSGDITIDELRKDARRRFPMITEEQIEQLFSGMDENRDGKVSWAEFIFSTLDADGSGDISLKEFSTAMRRADKTVSDPQVKQFFEELDTNHDGKLTRVEMLGFLEALTTASDSTKTTKLEHDQELLQHLPTTNTKRSGSEHTANILQLRTGTTSKKESVDGLNTDASEEIRETTSPTSKTPISQMQWAQAAAFAFAHAAEFDAIDTDASGGISLDELRAAMKRDDRNVTEAEVQRRWAELDFNRDGNVSRKEWVQAAEFAAMDTNKSGDITIDELRAAMKRDNPFVMEHEVRRKFLEMDLDGDGVISRREYGVAQEFSYVDTDSSGTISLDELRAAMKRDNPLVTDLEVERRWLQLDQNCDGSVSKNEFARAHGISLSEFRSAMQRENPAVTESQVQRRWMRR